MLCWAAMVRCVRWRWPLCRRRLLAHMYRMSECGHASSWCKTVPVSTACPSPRVSLVNLAGSAVPLPARTWCCSSMMPMPGDRLHATRRPGKARNEALARASRQGSAHPPASDGPPQAASRACGAAWRGEHRAWLGWWTKGATGAKGWGVVTVSI